jgi:hypothetical protein
LEIIVKQDVLQIILINTTIIILLIQDAINVPKIAQNVMVFQLMRMVIALNAKKDIIQYIKVFVMNYVLYIMGKKMAFAINVLLMKLL